MIQGQLPAFHRFVVPADRFERRHVQGKRLKGHETYGCGVLVRKVNTNEVARRHTRTARSLIGRIALLRGYLSENWRWQWIVVRIVRWIIAAGGVIVDSDVFGLGWSRRCPRFLLMSVFVRR